MSLFILVVNYYVHIGLSLYNFAAYLAAIGPRLADIFAQTDRSGQSCDEVADAMARRLIGR